jgi:DNA topoisomerase I
LQPSPLSEFKKYDSQAEAKHNVVAAIERVAKAYMSGDLVKMIDAKIARKFKQQYAQLTADDIMVLAFLRNGWRR